MIEARDEGQAAVEVALVLPLLVVLLLAVVQVALVARDQVLVVHAARAGARQASVATEPAYVRRAVEEASGLKGWRLDVETSPMGPGRVTVTTRVRYAAPTDVALLGPLLPDVVLESAATMRTEMSGSATLGEGTTTRQQEFAHPTTNPARGAPVAPRSAILGPRPWNG